MKRVKDTLKTCQALKRSESTQIPGNRPPWTGSNGVFVFTRVLRHAGAD